jgi:hypothetical protein
MPDKSQEAFSLALHLTAYMLTFGVPRTFAVVQRWHTITNAFAFAFEKMSLTKWLGRAAQEGSLRSTHPSLFVRVRRILVPRTNHVISVGAITVTVVTAFIWYAPRFTLALRSKVATPNSPRLALSEELGPIAVVGAGASNS